MARIAQDLVGKRYGRWLVLERVHTDRYVRWRCRCQCGNVKDVLAASLYLFLIYPVSSAESSTDKILFRCNFTPKYVSHLDINADRVLVDGVAVSNKVEINDRFITWVPDVKDFPQKVRIDRLTGEVFNKNEFGVSPSGKCTKEGPP